MKVDEKGFTLVELLVTLGILSAVGGVMSMAIATIMRITPQTNEHAVALQQVQNAGFWITRDVEMAQTVEVPEPPSDVLVSLEQDHDGDGVTDDYVDYLFDGSELRREVNDVSPGLYVADHIVEADTTFQQDPDITTKYNFTIKASLGDAEVERNYAATQRAPDEAQ